MAIDIDSIMQILSGYYDKGKLISQMDETEDPYRLLIACLLSLRTKDETTYEVAQNLFKIANTPEKIVKLKAEELEKIIFKTGFYHNKARTILDVTHILLDKYNGKVPNSLDKLLELKGVGLKTANLVLARGFNIPAICVDTHVHRISNRLGYVTTKNPIETEKALREKLPQQWWFVINSSLVRHGQEICKPVKPHCFECPIEKYCQKVNVEPYKPAKTKKVKPIRTKNNFME